MITFNFLSTANERDQTYAAVGKALIELAGKYPHFSILVQGHGGTVHLEDGAEMDFASPLFASGEIRQIASVEKRQFGSAEIRQFESIEKSQS